MLNMARGFAPFMPQQGTNISGSATSRAFGGEMLPAGAAMNQIIYGAGTPPQLDIDKAMPGFRIE
tara:strand:+ start:178 stop:372 length:195 start_codon:yes stop_codon:yes gene_type:complete